MNQRGEGEIFGFIVLILIGFVGVWGYNHFLKPAKWSLMYENSVGTVIAAGDYNSREACADALRQAKASPDRYSHPECGSNCKPPTTINGPYVCDDTFDI